MKDFSAGAIDLGQVKAQAEARAKAESTKNTAQAFVTVTQDNFEAEVAGRSMQVPVFMLVGSARSEASEQLKADFEAMAAQSGRRFIVAYLDADNNPMLVRGLGVRMVPTVMALAAGRMIANFEGEQPGDAIAQWVGQIVEQVGSQLPGLDDEDEAPVVEKEPEDPRMVEAKALLDAARYPEAIAAYDAIVTAEPKNLEAIQARAAAKTLQRLDAGEQGTDVDKLLLQADADVVSGAPDRAFDSVISAMSEYPDAKDRLRLRLFELFELFDPRDPRVLSARTKLASTLF